MVIHSRQKNADEVFAFVERAQLGVPLIAIPTRYPSVPGSEFSARGIHNLVFANQGMRTVITALQKNLQILKETSDLMTLEDQIVPVAEIFRLQGTDELDAAESKYLPARKPDDFDELARLEEPESGVAVTTQDGGRGSR